MTQPPLSKLIAEIMDTSELTKHYGLAIERNALEFGHRAACEKLIPALEEAIRVMEDLNERLEGRSYTLLDEGLKKIRALLEAKS